MVEILIIMKVILKEEVIKCFKNPEIDYYTCNIVNYDINHMGYTSSAKNFTISEWT